MFKCSNVQMLAGYLGPDFMAGVDQVTAAWNVFSVTPQSLAHILPMLGSGDVEEGDGSFCSCKKSKSMKMAKLGNDRSGKNNQLGASLARAVQISCQ